MACVVMARTRNIQKVTFCFPPSQKEKNSTGWMYTYTYLEGARGMGRLSCLDMWERDLDSHKTLHPLIIQTTCYYYYKLKVKSLALKVIALWALYKL